jgi:hypothetical protein
MCARLANQSMHRLIRNVPENGYWNRCRIPDSGGDYDWKCRDRRVRTTRIEQGDPRQVRLRLDILQRLPDQRFHVALTPFGFIGPSYYFIPNAIAGRLDISLAFQDIADFMRKKFIEKCLQEI